MVRGDLKKMAYVLYELTKLKEDTDDIDTQSEASIHIREAISELAHTISIEIDLDISAIKE